MAAASPPLLGMLQAGALGTAVAVLATLADDMAKAGGPATDALDRALTMLESACQWDDWEDLTQLSTRPNGLLLQMALVQLSCLLPEDTLRTRARTVWMPGVFSVMGVAGHVTVLAFRRMLKRMSLIAVALGLPLEPY